MDNNPQYIAMEKLLKTLVLPKFQEIIDDIKVVPSTKMSKNTPTVKVYLSPNLSVKNTSEVSFDIDWKITETLKLLGDPRYWIEFIQIQP